MVWTDTIHSCQNMQDQILNFQNTFDSACDEIILEIQSRKFLLKSNYINSTLYQNAVFWLVDERGIFDQFLVFSAFPPLLGYLPKYTTVL
jgi:hypothetical protein